MTTELPWQVRMFNKTLKKKMRLGALKKHLGPIGPTERCLLVTCGDNNGAMNYFLRQIGGEWSFADLEDICIDEMTELLGQEVSFCPPDQLPYEDDYFDRIITIDVHEHLDDAAPFSREVGRIAKPGAQVICTTPNGDETKLAVKIKHAVGMTTDEYGHTRVGVTSAELAQTMRENGIEPVRNSSFSRFFTEMLELTINFAYVKILAKKSEAPVEKGQIAPATKDQLKSVQKTFKIYSLIYPFYWLISQLDYLLFFTEGYVVVVEGKRAAA